MNSLFFTPIFLSFLVTGFTVPFAPFYPQEQAQDFVLECRKIELPDYPYAFNPSLVVWKGCYLMSFRDIPLPAEEKVQSDSSGSSHIGLVWLDKHFKPICRPQILLYGPQHERAFLPIEGEDSRLVSVDGEIYVIYGNNDDAKGSAEGHRVYFGKLVYEDDSFFLENPKKISDFPSPNQDRKEKNWVPFDYNGKLMMAYSLNPHRIFLPHDNRGSCDLIVETSRRLSWCWGELRGGTPALKINCHKYLAFFHSCIMTSTVYSGGAKTLHYYIGAYLFSSGFPFEITHMSPEPILGRGFYIGVEYPPRWKPVNVVFPCGYVIDGNDIWLSYGRQDYECWVVKLDKKRLLESLVPLD